MNTLSYKTISASKQNSKKEWFVIDAEGEVLGRLSSKVAKILRGKHKPNFTPHADCGDNVIIINAEKVRLTGRKLDQKQYVRHTGYPGGQRFANPRQLLNRKPEVVVEHAIKGMLPKNKLGRAIFGNLYVYAGTEHKHEAQKPLSLNVNDIK